MMRIAISGFGRIGRNFLRTILLDEQARKKLAVVAINIGPEKKEFVAHMFKYDTLMGTYPGNVVMKDDELIVDDYRIKIVAQADPAALPWKSLAIDWVVECSGHFTNREGAQKHVQAGAQHVLISAPAKDEDVTIIPGVNDAAYDCNKHVIVSLGSCTTNALVPMLKVMHDSFIIEQCLMTTVHAYTNSQVLLDVEDHDIRESRAAALNIIPTSTGAMKVAGKVIPELEGRIQAMAIRVPVAKVSIVDLTCVTKKSVTKESINAAFEQAAAGAMKGILGITMEPLVSSDFNGDSRSSIVDGLLTSVSGSTMSKTFGWYDNEWGYSCRLRDFLMRVSGL